MGVPASFDVPNPLANILISELRVRRVARGLSWDGTWQSKIPDDQDDDMDRGEEMWPSKANKDDNDKWKDEWQFKTEKGDDDNDDDDANNDDDDDDDEQQSRPDKDDKDQQFPSHTSTGKGSGDAHCFVHTCILYFP